MKKFILLIIEKIRKSLKVDEKGNSFGWRKGILLLAAFMMVGCDYQNPDGSYDTSRSIDFETIVVDSCEYVRGQYKFAHKGNCRFCKERRQKELKELVIKLKEQ